MVYVLGSGRGRALMVATAVTLLASGLLSCRFPNAGALTDVGASRHLDNTFREENHRAILDYLDGNVTEPAFGGRVFSAYHVMGSSPNRIYVWAFCMEYSKGAGERLEKGTGVSLPVALSVEVRDGVLNVTGHKRPRDGTLWIGDVEDLFPSGVQGQIERIHKGDTMRELESRCESRARARLGMAPPPPEWRFLLDGLEPKPESPRS